jgi:hypothetical protein
LEQSAPVLEQGLPQAHFDGFAIADSVPGQILAGEPQEGFGFLELLVGDLCRLEFFLRSESPASSRLI